MKNADVQAFLVNGFIQSWLEQGALCSCLRSEMLPQIARCGNMGQAESHGEYQLIPRS